MDYKSPEDFIKNHLRYKQHWKKNRITISDAVWQTLDKDTWIDGCAYAAGSQFKVCETQNFGFVLFASGTKTPDGNTPGKRIIKW